MRTGVLYRR